MYLYIDPSKHNSIRLIVFRDGGSSIHTVVGKNRELLSVIEGVFRSEEYLLQDLEGILVLGGEGSFSGTRIAAVVANTLAFALHIPVVSTTRDHEPAPDTITQFFQNVEVGRYITPVYSGEPNIGGV